MWPLWIPVLLLGAYVAYNRFFHPLAKVPGPLFAGISPLWLAWQGYNQRRPALDLRLHKKYGSVVRIAPDEVIFSNPKYFKEVYGAGTRFTKGHFYEAPTDALPDTIDKLDMLAERDIEKLRVQKRLAGPVYSVANAKKHEALIDNNSRRWMKRLRGLAGQAVDMYPEIEMLNVDTLTEFTFAHPFGAVEAGTDGRHMASMEKLWAHWGWVGYLPLLNWMEKRFRIWHGKMHFRRVPTKKPSQEAVELPVFPFGIGKIGAYQSAVDEGKKVEPCLLDDMRNLTRERPEFRFNWGTSLAMTDLGAGVDTSSWTMASFIAGVCMNEHAYERLQAELDAAVKAGELKRGDSVPYDSSAKLEYFQTCLHEAMRLWPNIAISLPRIVPKEGIEIDGYFVPPGYTLGMNSKQLGITEEVFGADGHAFRPERWLEASKERRNDMENRNLAFGGPSRKCPGKNVAWVMMSKNLATLFLNFDVKVLNKLDGEPGPGGRQWVEKGSFPTKWLGMEVRLTPR